MIFQDSPQNSTILKGLIPLIQKGLQLLHLSSKGKRTKKRTNLSCQELSVKKISSQFYYDSHVARFSMNLGSEFPNCVEMIEKQHISLNKRPPSNKCKLQSIFVVVPDCKLYSSQSLTSSLSSSFPNNFMFIVGVHLALYTWSPVITVSNDTSQNICLLKI